MAWKGDPQNPVPNLVQEPIERSEKKVGDNRAHHVRRDTDSQKDFSIGLYDIDETILNHLKGLNLQVTDAGKKIEVPVFYGSPEKWTSAQRDGYLRDNNGKLILPAIVIKRTSSDDDTTLRFFNRYLSTSVIKTYSPKNKYTKFSVLQNANVPVNEVYNLVMPSHMILTYHVIIWTEYVEQMNKLVEDIRFNSNDYWGTKDGFKFRTRIESYGHTVELQTEDDRIVKTEFDMVTHGYILPDSMTKLDKHVSTHTKMFTPKKIVLGTEIVSDGRMPIDSNREKWRNPNYPNLQRDVVIPSPSISYDTSIIDGHIGIKVDNSPLFLRIVPVPLTQNSRGQDGDMSYDSAYFYLHVDSKWKRVAISQFTADCNDNIPLTSTVTNVSVGNAYFYVYSNNQWRRVAISDISTIPPNIHGNVAYDGNYIYLSYNNTWKRVSLSLLS